MRFTWSYELVGPKAIMLIINAVQKSAREQNGVYIIQLGELKSKFSALYGYSKPVSDEHFDEPVRLLRKSGVIWNEVAAKTGQVIHASEKTLFTIDLDVLAVDSSSEQDVFSYLARRAAIFHLPFKMMLQIIEEYPQGVVKERLREILSDRMLQYAKSSNEIYLKSKVEAAKKSQKPWLYSSAHLNSLLSIAQKALIISNQGDLIKGLRVNDAAEITYEQYKGAAIEEYRALLKRDPDLLMVSLDKLNTLVCGRLRSDRKKCDKMLQTLILRNLDTVKVYRQEAEHGEKGLLMPDGSLIYALTIAGGPLK